MESSDVLSVNPIVTKGDDVVNKVRIAHHAVDGADADVMTAQGKLRTTRFARLDDNRCRRDYRARVCPIGCVARYGGRAMMGVNII